MANKDCLILVLDVRQTTTEEFKKKSIKCAADIIKDKICRANKDCVGLIAFGSKLTGNVVNSGDFPDNYLNIVQYDSVQIPNWQFLTNFYKFAQQPSCNDGDWLEALVVAMELLRTTSDIMKFQHQRIVLFHDFDGKANTFDIYDLIMENILKTEINLFVVSSNVKYIDNPKTGEPQVILDGTHKTEAQLKEEKYTLDMITNGNATFCNYENALFHIKKLINNRPWTWNAKLTIGSKICIFITGVIAIKDESFIKLKMRWGKPGDLVTHDLVFKNNGHEIKPEPDELVTGYMLGGTPIAYEEISEPKEKPEASLRFLGFTARESIPVEYFMGDSMYTIVHRKGKIVSAQKMDALVRALLEMDVAMLCWKIYSVKFCRPKLVVLVPNQIQDDKPATLMMVELSYHSQHIFCDFPKMVTKSTESNAAQLEAIDKLIDSMDLTIPLKDQTPRDLMHRDLLPFDMLPHVFEENLRDVLERKVICLAAETDEDYLDLFDDKNFVERYFKVPEAIEEKAKKAVSEVKKLFPLEKIYATLDKAKARAAAETAKKQIISSQVKGDIKPLLLDVERVGLKNPADDFEQLLLYNVLPVTDLTHRDTKFHEIAEQMRTAIWTLLFNSGTAVLEMQVIRVAIHVYRKYSSDFNAFDEYNQWIQTVKVAVAQRKLYDFWRVIIVENQLGPVVAGELSLEEKIKLEEFYEMLEDDESMENKTTNGTELDETAIDELLAKEEKDF